MTVKSHVEELSRNVVMLRFMVYALGSLVLYALLGRTIFMLL